LAKDVPFNRGSRGPAIAKQPGVEIRYSDSDRVGDSRTRTYAHYRVFEAFRSVARHMRTVDVLMARDRRAGHPHRVRCTVLAEPSDGAQITVTATGDWPYAAIQRAATQARQRMDDRLTSCANETQLPSSQDCCCAGLDQKVDE
jgi:hypothetical protein